MNLESFQKIIEFTWMRKEIISSGRSAAKRRLNKMGRCKKMKEEMNERARKINRKKNSIEEERKHESTSKFPTVRRTEDFFIRFTHRISIT